MKRKKYVVHVTEIYGRDVCVDAYDECEAEEIVEAMCCNDEVNLNTLDFADRRVEAIYEEKE